MWLSQFPSYLVPLRPKFSRRPIIIIIIIIIQELNHEIWNVSDWSLQLARLPQQSYIYLWSVAAFENEFFQTSKSTLHTKHTNNLENETHLEFLFKERISFTHDVTNRTD